MREHGLQLAVEKTEAVILKGGRKGRGEIKFELRGDIIKPKKSITYLGICLDQGCTFGEHVKTRVNKANKTANALCQLMPNIGGPTNRKRTLLVTAVQSMLLYGAEVWHQAMKIKL